MTALDVTRVSPGNYLTIVHDETYAITLAGMGYWEVTRSSDASPYGHGYASRRDAISALEALARQPANREVSDTLKLFRRGLIKKGTQLTISGIVGRCVFDAYTRKDDGAEWIDITVMRTLNRRTVRPERITRVHRTK